MLMVIKSSFGIQEPFGTKIVNIDKITPQTRRSFLDIKNIDNSTENYIILIFDDI